MLKMEFARLLGVSPPRVTQFIKMGLPVLADGAIPKELALKWVSASTTGPAQERARELLSGPETPPGFGILDELENPVDKASVFGLLAMSLRIRSLATIAAFQAGATREQSEKAGAMTLLFFVQAAEDFLVETKTLAPGTMAWPGPDLHDEANLDALTDDKKKNIKKINRRLKH